MPPLSKGGNQAIVSDVSVTPVICKGPCGADGLSVKSNILIHQLYSPKFLTEIYTNIILTISTLYGDGFTFQVF